MAQAYFGFEYKRAGESEYSRENRVDEETASPMARRNRVAAPVELSRVDHTLPTARRIRVLSPKSLHICMYNDTALRHPASQLPKRSLSMPPKRAVSLHVKP